VKAGELGHDASQSLDARSRPSRSGAGALPSASPRSRAGCTADTPRARNRRAVPDRAALGRCLTSGSNWASDSTRPTSPTRRRSPRLLGSRAETSASSSAYLPRSSASSTSIISARSPAKSSRPHGSIWSSARHEQGAPLPIIAQLSPPFNGSPAVLMMPRNANTTGRSGDSPRLASCLTDASCGAGRRPISPLIPVEKTRKAIIRSAGEPFNSLIYSSGAPHCTA